MARIVRRNASRPAPEEQAVPDRIKPQLASEVRALPAGDWGLELKFDGYRLMARVKSRNATLLTSNGHDWSEKMPVLRSELQLLPVQNVWLDGEVVAMAPDGTPSFSRLQEAFARKATEEVQYFAFDLLFLDGADLRREPLKARRVLLQRLISKANLPHLQFSETFEHDLASLMASARKMRLEGLMAKKLDAPYQEGRTTTWLKLKCNLRQEFVVGGFISKTGDASGLDRLILGVFSPQGDFRYCGSVQPTLKGTSRQKLFSQLEALRGEKAPFSGSVKEHRSGLHWVTPSLVAEVEFTEWTRNGHIRNASFVGMREDKPAADVRRETPIDSLGHRAIKVTHPEKVLDPASKTTKLEIIQYAETIAEWALPHLRARPVSLLRAPDGIDHELFFQKHLQGQRLQGITELPVELYPGHAPLLTIDTAEALISAAQLNVIELHAWNATAPNLDHPDRVIFDLDPDPALAWDTLRQAATLVKTLLDELGLDSWIKTSGGKGFHIVVPLEAIHSWKLAKEFSKILAQHLSKVLPSHFSATSGAKNRVGKIFVDYLRNSKGATTVTAYSLRARPGLRVSVPVTWEELKDVRSADQWTMAETLRRTRTAAFDPWSDFWGCTQQLNRSMWEILGLKPPVELGT
jgi:bifunctional non-homologous end joining protein LigD